MNSTTVDCAWWMVNNGGSGRQGYTTARRSMELTKQDLVAAHVGEGAQEGVNVRLGLLLEHQRDDRHKDDPHRRLRGWLGWI